MRERGCVCIHQISRQSPAKEQNRPPAFYCTVPTCYERASERDGANTGPHKDEDPKSPKQSTDYTACRYLYKAAAIGETTSAVALGPLMLRRKSARLDDGAAEVLLLLVLGWLAGWLGFRSPVAPLLGSLRPVQVSWIRDGTPLPPCWPPI